MSVHRLSEVFSACFMIILIHVDAATFEKHHWSTLSAYTDKLCPYNTICRTGKPTLSSGSELTGCCKECSCSKTCGLTQNCCYSELDQYHKVDRSHQECLYPMTKEPQQKYKSRFNSYYMVVNSYPNGTGIECGDKKTTCGENRNASPLGSLYPVFSKRTGLIYKNRKCASCHGVKDDEGIEWKAMLMCGIQDDRTLGMLDVSTFFDVLETNKLPDNCEYRFSYPGSYSDLKIEKCGVKPVHSCQAEGGIPLPTDLNMTFEEVRAACYSDLQSPYYFGSIFANVFCSLCSNYSFRFNPARQCVVPDQGHKGNTGDVKSFRSLIDFDFINEKNKLETTDFDKHRRIVCAKLDDTSVDPDDCKTAYCPSAKVMLGPDRCTYPSTEWYTDNLDVVLKLYPQKPIQVSDVEAIARNSGFQLTDKSLVRSPWPKQWTVTAFLYEQQSHPTHGDIIKYFLAKIRYKRKTNYNIKKVVGEIRKYMAHIWFLNVAGSAVKLKQTFSEYKHLTLAGSRIGQFTPMIMAPKFARNLTLPLLTKLASTVIEHSLTINKMFFCDQVQINLTEYTFDAYSRLLYQNKTNRIFFEGEIALVFDNNGVIVPRICIEDAAYAFPPQFDKARTIVSVKTILASKLLGIILLYSFF